MIGRWDENDNVVCSVAEALGEIGSVKAVPHLLAVVEKIEDARLQAVEALGKIGDPGVLDKLYGFLDSSDPMLLYAVIEAIGDMGNPDAVKRLWPFLKSDDRLIADVAMMAVIKISRKTGGKIDFDLPLDSFKSFLFDGIKNKNDDITEFTLARIPHWYGQDVIKGLLEVLDYVDEDILIRITEILATAGHQAGKMIVMKLSDASSDTKIRLLDVVQQFIDEDLAAEILTLVEDPDQGVRQKAAQVLGVSGFMGAIPVLTKLAGDPIGHVRAAAFSALGWLCTVDEVEFIFNGLDDKYPDVREAALGALIIIGGEKVVEKFYQDLRHDDIERQRLAVSALGWIGEDNVIEPLVEAINHSDPGIRRSAISSLYKIGYVPDLRPIKVALHDENSAVRKAAVTALVGLAGEEVINDIRFLLDDEDIWVKYHTINAIGEIGQKKFDEYIIPYLDDDLDIIKIAAVKAISQMSSHEALPALDKLTKEKNQDLAKAAEKALSAIGGNK